MNLIIDLELNQVVKGWGNRNPTDPILVKSQDTPAMAVYFGRAQTNFDLGASPGIRFALYVLGSPNALIDISGFTRQVDTQNKVAYIGYPNFNTTQMQAAMAGLASIQTVGEVRYQTPGGTIARTLDIPFTVNRSLLQESAYDTTTAAFTVPAVNGTVTLHINHTGWLAPNQNITIGNGGGAYQVVSVTNPTDFIAKNLGGTANAAAATVIPSGTSVGNTPTSALGVYPDPSTIELLTHKNQPNGYAGLGSASKLNGSVLPVDGTTIVVNSGGNLAAASILAITSANFTTPAASATVSVTFLSTSSLLANIYVRIPIAGFYLVQSITDSTHAVLQNVGDPLNASAGTTITSGAPLLPAQAVSGGGTSGVGGNAYTTLSANFIQPAVNATVTVNVGTTAWMAPGQAIFIQGGGYYSVSSIADLSHAVVTNLGGTSNVAPGATVTGSGTQTVAPAGVPGVSSYTLTTANFTMPAAGASVTIALQTTAFIQQNQNIFVAGAGYFVIASIIDSTHVAATNLGASGNISSGTVISSGAGVTTAGAIGPTGSTGPTGPAGATGSGSTIYTGSSLQGNGNVATPATLVADIAQGTGAYKVYQRDSSGNGKWDVALLSAVDAVSGPGSGEISHIQSQTSGVLSLKKLKSGTTGSVVLTDQGGSTGDILVDVPVDGTTIQVSGGHLVAAGGGGGGAFNPQGANGGFWAYEDFVWSQTDAARWTSGSSGGGTQASNTSYGYNSTLKAQGVWELATLSGVAVAAVGSAVANGLIGLTGGALVLGAGTLDLAWRIAIEEASLPATGVGYFARIGLMNQSGSLGSNFPAFGSGIGTNPGTSAIVLEYSPDNNSGNFRIGYLFNSGSVTYTNCSAGPSANTFGWWELKITSAGVVTAYFNGSLIGSVTASSSLLGIPLIPYVVFWRGNGVSTAFKLAIDTYYLGYPYNR